MINSVQTSTPLTRVVAPLAAGPEGPCDTFVPSSREPEWLPSARSQLEVNKAWLARWQANNPWDTFHRSPPPVARQLWAQPKRLSKEERKTVKKLIDRGIKEKYARQLVERKEFAWIKIMLRRPEKKK